MKLFVLSLFLLLIYTDNFAQNTLQPDTALSNTYYSKGESLVTAGELAKAKVYFEKSLESNPKHSMSNVYLAFCEYKLNNYQQVIAPATRALEIDSTLLDAIKFRAYAYVALSEYEKAIPGLNRAIKADGKDFFNYDRRGAAWLGLGETDLAYEDFKQSNLLNPADQKVIYHMGYAAMKKGNDKEALELIDRAIRLGYKAVNAYYLRGEFLLEKNNYAAAAEDLKMALELSAQNKEQFVKEATARKHLGIAYYELHAYENAASYLEPLITKDSAGVADYILGLSYLYLKQETKSKELFLKGIDLKPDDGAFYFGYGELLLSGNKTAEAKESFLKAMNLESKVAAKAIFYSNLSYSFLKMADTLNTLSCLEMAIEDKPEKAELYVRRLALLNTNKDRKLILKDCNKLIEINEKQPEVAAFYTAQKSMFLMMYELYDDAWTSIDKAIKLDPYGEYFALRAYFRLVIALGQGDREIKMSGTVQKEMLEDVDLAIASGERKMDAYLLKTTILIALERNDEACEAAGKAMTLGAEISKMQLKYLCTGKEPAKRDDEWSFSYSLSDYEHRFGRK